MASRILEMPRTVLSATGRQAEADGRRVRALPDDIENRLAPFRGVAVALALQSAALLTVLAGWEVWRMIR